MPALTLGFDTTNDPAAGLFTHDELPGATTAETDQRAQSLRDADGPRHARSPATPSCSRTGSTSTAAIRSSRSTSRSRHVHPGSVAAEADPDDQRRPALRAAVPDSPDRVALLAERHRRRVRARRDVGAAAPNAPEATIGCQFGMPGVPLTGAAPTYKQYTAGDPGLQPRQEQLRAVGRRRPGSRASTRRLLRKMLGDPGLADRARQLRRAFNQGGAERLPGHAAQRSRPDGERQSQHDQPEPRAARARAGRCCSARPSRLGPPATCAAGQTVGCIPTSATYPQAINFTTGIPAFDPNYQTSYTDSWSVGFQRAVGKNIAVEIRYIGNRNDGRADDGELQRAGHLQRRLRLAARTSSTSSGRRRATWPPTSRPAAARRSPTRASRARRRCRSSSPATPAGGRRPAADPAAYTGTQWTQHGDGAVAVAASRRTSARSRAHDQTRPTVSSATRRSAPTASPPGMPANFWVMNPDVRRANVRTAEGFTRTITRFSCC